ncbi:MAG: PEGA domain-containing protein [Pseudomonadota bacterium]
MNVSQSIKLSMLLPIPVFFYGCGGIGLAPSNNVISVNSVPSEAKVYVMGHKIGNTPLKVQQRQVFPVVFDPDDSTLYGTITLKKEGCTDYREKVSFAVLEDGINAQMDCIIDRKILTKPVVKEIIVEKSTPAKQNMSVKVKQIPAPKQTENFLSKTLQERILRINRLLKNKLISQEEYDIARKNILDEL